MGKLQHRTSYADAMIKSGPPGDVQRLERLHEKAIKIVDNKQHPKATLDQLRNLYKICSIDVRQDEHVCSLMYGLSKNTELILHHRLRVRLRKRDKIKFKPYKRTYEKYLKSPVAREISLWDRLPEGVQKSTTKFKFKRAVQDILY